MITQTHESIREEAKLIASRRHVPEFAAAVEWRKFAVWFTGLGATTRRWWDEWPAWLDEMERGE